LEKIQEETERKHRALEEDFQQADKELKELQVMKIVSESDGFEQVEGVRLPLDPYAEGDRVEFDAKTKTLTVNAKWNTDSKSCELLKSPKYIQYTVDGDIQEKIPQMLKSYFADPGKDSKDPAVLVSTSYNSQSDIDRFCALDQAKELEKVLSKKSGISGSS
jgi:hypothetical protein